MESSALPIGSKDLKMVESLVIMMAMAWISPLTLSIGMHKLTGSGMARKTPLNRSLAGLRLSYLNPVVTPSICNARSKILMTGGWLGRSPASTSSIMKWQNSPCRLRSCMKSLMLPTTPGPCLRSNSFSPGHLKRQPGLRTSRGRLVCHAPLSDAKAVDEDISSNWRVMSLAMRMPGGYRSLRII